MKKEKLGFTKVELPEVLIYYEVLLRLPAESLVRFKIVSKQWFLWITSSDFVKQHLSLVLKKPQRDFIFRINQLNIVQDKHLCIDDVSEQEEDKQQWNEVRFEIGEETQYNSVTLESTTCNGLFLLRATTEYHIRDSLYICNPITQLSMKIYNCLPLDGFIFTLVHIAERYKIVAIPRTWGYFGSYVLKLPHNNNWEECVGPSPAGHPVVPFHQFVLHQPCIFLNDKLYWLTCNDDIPRTDPRSPVIYSISLDKENHPVRDIGRPPGLHGWPHCLLEMKGSLYMTDTISLYEVDVMVLVKDDGVVPLWSKAYSINLSFIENISDPYCNHILFNTVVGDTICVAYLNQLFLYNTRTGESRLAFEEEGAVICTFSGLPRITFFMFPHVNSLVSWD